jgi:CBS domain-containing protein
MLHVRDVLKNKDTPVITIEPDRDVSGAAHVMMKHGIGGVPVVDERGDILGMVAERDIVRAIDESSGSIQDVPVRRIMHAAATCSPDDPLHELMARLTRERLRHVIVVENGRMVGIISVGDLVKHRLDQLETETGVLRDYVAAQRASRS